MKDHEVLMEYRLEETTILVRRSAARPRTLIWAESEGRRQLVKTLLVVWESAGSAYMMVSLLIALIF